MKINEVINDIYKSSLPNGKILNQYIKKYNLKTIVDLTQRERKVVKNTCDRNNVDYKKIPVGYDCCDVENIVKQILKLKKPLLYFCFHGRDRTGKVSRIIKRMNGRVILYRVGRNLNRAYRTCEAFGISEMQLIECNGQIKGNLFNAKNRVKIIEDDNITNDSIIAFETSGEKEITQVDFNNVNTVLIGGETTGIPITFKGEIYKIPQIGNVSGLTVEAALAIILYEWGR